MYCFLSCVKHNHREHSVPLHVVSTQLGHTENHRLPEMLQNSADINDEQKIPPKRLLRCEIDYFPDLLAATMRLQPFSHTSNLKLRVIVS